MSLADFAASSLRPSERPASASETNELMALDDDDAVKRMVSALGVILINNIPYAHSRTESKTHNTTTIRQVGISLMRAGGIQTTGMTNTIQNPVYLVPGTRYCT